MDPPLKPLPSFPPERGGDDRGLGGGAAGAGKTGGGGSKQEPRRCVVGAGDVLGVTVPKQCHMGAASCVR